MVITAAWSEHPHREILTHTSARHWRAAASASATAFSVVSVRLSSPSWTDALCEDDASLSPWLARLSFSPPAPLRRVLRLFFRSSSLRFSYSFSVLRYVLLLLSHSVRVCVFVRVRVLAAVGRRLRRRRFRRRILVNDNGANIARGNIKNVRWDNVGLEEVWSQKRCWHPPPLTAALPRNT